MSYRYNPPCLQKGDHGVRDKHKKITVLLCIGTLFESILNNRLSFKNVDNTFILCAIIDKQSCLSKPLYTCSVDFTKAFDYVDRTA